jgi:hypothetical protein
MCGNSSRIKKGQAYAKTGDGTASSEEAKAIIRLGRGCRSWGPRSLSRCGLELSKLEQYYPLKKEPAPIKESECA